MLWCPKYLDPIWLGVTVQDRFQPASGQSTNLDGMIQHGWWWAIWGPLQRVGADRGGATGIDWL